MYIFALLTDFPAESGIVEPLIADLEELRVGNFVTRRDILQQFAKYNAEPVHADFYFLVSLCLWGIYIFCFGF